MPAVRLSGVSFKYEDPIEVLSDLTVHLDAGWTGIVGENGCGKTTLLGLVGGELVADGGSIEHLPADATRYLCPQRVTTLTADVSELGAAWERNACRLRARLSLEPEQLERWPTLSPGERKRWQVGAALWRRPDVLLLDEPTNHIDATGRSLLVDALRRFRGVGLLVSHDRELLDELCQRVVLLRGGGATTYRGNYSQARQQWEQERSLRCQLHAAARDEQRKLEQRMKRASRQRTAAEARISARGRIKGPRDSDARSINAKERVKKAEARLSRQVHVVRAAAERRAAETERLRVDRERGRSLFVDYEAAPMSRLFSLERETIYAGSRPLLHEVTVAVDRDSRVHIAGDNGSGKTSLLRALIAAAGERSERVLYVPQELDDGAGPRLLQTLTRTPPPVRDRVLAIAAAMGMDPTRVLASSRPSPGELRKLMIALGLGASVWAVVLDEPTNHLDLPSIERLEAALSAYPGALVLVSHDRELATAVTNTTWRVGEGRVVIE